MLQAANRTGTQVIWDLCHYGWPDGLDIWSPQFVDRFGQFAAAVARLVRDETDAVPLYCPVNEISFWAWAGGQAGCHDPYERGRGAHLKEQLVRASIAAIEAIKAADPRARIVHAEPVIHITPRRDYPLDPDEVTQHLEGQWEAWDMLGGRRSPELGGRPEYLDILGVNFYPINQWVHHSGSIPLGRHDFRPFRAILAEAFHRYRRPLFVAETGAEGSAGPAWLHYIADEVQAARAKDVRVEGICLYPILDYPGWENDRVCPVGLLGLAPGPGGRAVHEPLAAELRRQLELIASKGQDKDRASVARRVQQRRR
jgi:hypothetical protein